MATYIRPFGDNKILFTETEGRLDFALTPVITFLNQTPEEDPSQNPNSSLNDFTSTNDKIVIGGIPLTLAKQNIPIASEFSTHSGSDNYPYSLKVIVKTEITPPSFNPSNPIIYENSFVWTGNRLTLSQDNDAKMYFNIQRDIKQSIIPVYQTTIAGIQLALNNDRELILYEEDLNIENIEEYVNIMIGGSPLTAGRVGNNWYLIVYQTGVVSNWNPTEINGLELWLDADQDVTLVDGKVSEWKDQSGKGNHIIQNTENNRPLYTRANGPLNNHASVVFNRNESNLLECLNLQSPISQPCTIILMLKIDSEAVSIQEYVYTTGAGTDVPNLRLQQETQQLLMHDTGRSTNISDASHFAEWHIRTNYWNGLTSEIWDNWDIKETGATTTGVIQDFPALYFGARPDQTRALSMSISEFIFYNRQLTTDEVNLLKIYFNTKYALSL